MTHEQPSQQEEIFARGKLFELVHLPQEDGRIFEVARRAPGVRIIIADQENKKVLLTREFRRELGAWDYRLPGGKVFDSLEEFDAFRASGKDINDFARDKAVQEASEETGIVIEELKSIKKSTLGATVEWDLHVFESTKWQVSSAGQQLEQGEHIVADTWVDYAKAEEMILNGDMQEERIAFILLQWLHQQGETREV